MTYASFRPDLGDYGAELPAIHQGTFTPVEAPPYLADVAAGSGTGHRVINAPRREKPFRHAGAFPNGS